MAIAVGRPVDVHAYADRIVIRQDGELVGEHPRSFARGKSVYDPALRAGAGKEARRPAQRGTIQKLGAAGIARRVRRRLASVHDGDRQMVDVLAAVLVDGLPAIEAACAEALDQGVHSADVILNILARRRDVAASVTILTPAALQFHHLPVKRLRPL